MNSDAINNGDDENTSLLNDDDSIRGKEFVSSVQSQTRELSINGESSNNNAAQGISWYFAIFLIVNAALGYIIIFYCNKLFNYYFYYFRCRIIKFCTCI